MKSPARPDDIDGVVDVKQPRLQLRVKVSVATLHNAALDRHGFGQSIPVPIPILDGARLHESVYVLGTGIERSQFILER